MCRAGVCSWVQGKTVNTKLHIQMCQFTFSSENTQCLEDCSRIDILLELISKMAEAGRTKLITYPSQENIDLSAAEKKKTYK